VQDSVILKSIQQPATTSTRWLIYQLAIYNLEYLLVVQLPTLTKRKLSCYGSAPRRCCGTFHHPARPSLWVMTSSSLRLVSATRACRLTQNCCCTNTFCVSTQTCLFRLRCMLSFRHDVTARPVFALVLSRINNCNDKLSSLPMMTAESHQHSSTNRTWYTTGWTRDPFCDNCTGFQSLPGSSTNFVCWFIKQWSVTHLSTLPTCWHQSQSSLCLVCTLPVNSWRLRCLLVYRSESWRMRVFCGGTAHVEQTADRLETVPFPFGCNLKLSSSHHHMAENSILNLWCPLGQHVGAQYKTLLLLLLH